MEAELNEWKEGEMKRQKQFDGKESQAEHIRRIRERAEAARKKTEEAAEDLFSDIADQINGQINGTDHRKLR